MSTQLKLKKISKLYQDDNNQGDYALKNVNMQVKPQEWLTILGNQGSGKSTLFNILGLLDRPTTGAYLINGSPTGALNETQLTRLREQTLSYLFRALFLNSRQSVMRNIILPLTQKGTPTPQAKEIASEQLAYLGQETLQDKMVRELTFAQKQFVCLASALATGNEILLADDPFKPLEEHDQEQLLNYFKQIHEEKQKTIIILSEQSELLTPHSDRVLHLYQQTITAF